MPFSSRLLVDEDKILDIIDRIRVAVPGEIKQARRVIGQQERLIGEAEAKVQQALDEQGLLAAVETERARLIDQAERDATGIRAGADDYAAQVLGELEQRLQKLTASVQNGLGELRKKGDGA
ncbi:MAG: hypothetical protein H7Z42_09320 [Roseiflexaceae bacterium]|nr:hypothetical protein [Roseiflexaceae bacterium]